jgi:ABC-2 type transport system ATP-binding protein
MRARLAMAVALGVEPDVLLLDEVLAVGDQVFFDKCLERIREHHARGRTLVVVSHQLDLLASLCSRVVWLQEGRIVGDGEPDSLVESYKASALAALRSKLQGGGSETA